MTDSKDILQKNDTTSISQIIDVWITGKGEFKVVNIRTDPTVSIWLANLEELGRLLTCDVNMLELILI